jgi:hypothetical protein
MTRVNATAARYDCVRIIASAAKQTASALSLGKNLASSDAGKTPLL